MKKFHTNSLKALAFSASAIAFAIAAPAYAQDAEPGDECITGANAAGVVDADGECVSTGEGPTGATTGQGEDVDISTGAAGETPQGGGITVTGSRIVRDTYSSISPLQVLSTENQQSVGAFDPAQILQRSEAASGQQIDATFLVLCLIMAPVRRRSTFVVLVRTYTCCSLMVAGLHQAGSVGRQQHLINLIPSSLVDRYDLLLDGASSIYGSDAVAGVANIILRKDFDGLEFSGKWQYKPAGSGEDYIISGAWGFNTDRACSASVLNTRIVMLLGCRDRDFFADDETNVRNRRRWQHFHDGPSRQRNCPQPDARRNTSPNECRSSAEFGRFISQFQTYGNLWSISGNGNSGTFRVMTVRHRRPRYRHRW